MLMVVMSDRAPHRSDVHHHFQHGSDGCDRGTRIIFNAIAGHASSSTITAQCDRGTRIIFNDHGLFNDPGHA
jgi:hypothetical protein